MAEHFLPPDDAAGAFPPANPWDAGSSHEIALRELLRSPLDEEPRRARGTGRRRLIAVAVLPPASLTVRTTW